MQGLAPSLAATSWPSSRRSASTCTAPWTSYCRGTGERGQGSESPSPHGTGRGRPVLHQEFLERKQLFTFFPSRFKRVISNMYFKTARGRLASCVGPTRVWLCPQVRDRLVQPLPPQAEAHPPGHDPAHPAPGAQVPVLPVRPPRVPLPSASNVAIGYSKLSGYHSHGSPDEAHLLSWPCPSP